MQFAHIYHYVGYSDLLGIIPCRRIKVSPVKSLRSPIPCRSAQDSCFDLCSHAGRTFQPFAQWHPLDHNCHCQFLPCQYSDSSGIFSFNPLHFSLMPPILDSLACTSMEFAHIYHYVSRSDSLGIIPCRQIKVSLVNSLCRRHIQC
jgi:hypothetical protein